MQLTEHFELKEFECRDGSKTPPEVIENLKELAENLEIIREEIGMPIRITSGYRSPEYNKKVGGAEKSQHLTGKAADITVRDLYPFEVHQVVDSLMRNAVIKLGGLGLYKGFVHYDIRETYARW